MPDNRAYGTCVIKRSAYTIVLRWLLSGGQVSWVDPIDNHERFRPADTVDQAVTVVRNYYLKTVGE
jgi:hypothetical protein